MKKTVIFLLVLICLIIISCGGDIKISFFTRDLLDVVNEREKVIYTNVNMVVESLTDEKDIEFLRTNLNGFSNDHFVEYNYSKSLSFDIKIPIVKDGTAIDFSKDLLIITGKNSNGKIDYSLKYNKELFAKIDRYIYKTHYQNIELNRFKIRFEINNDERAPVSLITYSSYINGKAYPFEHEELLKERDRIEVEISEIFSKFISNMSGDNYPIFSLKK